MKKYAFLVFVILIIFGISKVYAECNNALQVTGEASEIVKPDVAYVTLYAQAEGILMEDAINKTEKLVKEISEAVKKETTIIKQIKIKDISLGETKSEVWRSNQTQEPPRPQVTKQIRVFCEPNPKEIYKIIDRAIRSGALMQISSSIRYHDSVPSVVAYGAENVTEVIDRLKRLAIEDAKNKAEKLATLVGKNIGDVVGIGCSSVRSFEQSLRIMGQLPDFPTKHIGLNPKEIKIVHNISVSYSLK
jgi:uncharacterized protein YggE